MVSQGTVVNVTTEKTVLQMIYAVKMHLPLYELDYYTWPNV